MKYSAIKEELKQDRAKRKYYSFIDEDGNDQSRAFAYMVRCDRRTQKIQYFNREDNKWYDEFSDDFCATNELFYCICLGYCDNELDYEYYLVDASKAWVIDTELFGSDGDEFMWSGFEYLELNDKGNIVRKFDEEGDPSKM